MQLQYLRILILDDHAPSTAVLSMALTSRGHVCEVAGGVDDALARVASFRPDVVFYEWALRDGGPGIATRLRAASTLTLAVVALSAMDEPDGFREAEGVDGYLVKPFEVALLESVLHR